MILTLIRHAKSSWSDLSLDDFDRPLNERGNRDAPKMAQWFSKNTQEKPIFFLVQPIELYQPRNFLKKN